MSSTSTSHDPERGVLALWAATGPIVATFHTSNLRSRAMQPSFPCCDPRWRRSRARIAVSEDARRTVTTHIGGDAVVIPNGVYVADFAGAAPAAVGRASRGAPHDRLPRADRRAAQGIAVLAAAFDAVLRGDPGARLLVAGPGDGGRGAERMAPRGRRGDRVPRRGRRRDQGPVLRSIDCMPRPTPAGRASGSSWWRRWCRRPGRRQRPAGLPRVLDDGEPPGPCSPTRTPGSGPGIVGLLRIPQERARLAGEPAGPAGRPMFDWSVVADKTSSGRLRRPSAVAYCAAATRGAMTRIEMLEICRSSCRVAGTCPTARPGSTDCTLKSKGRCRRSMPLWCAGPRPPWSWPTAGCSTPPRRCCWPRGLRITGADDRARGRDDLPTVSISQGGRVSNPAHRRLSLALNDAGRRPSAVASILTAHDGLAPDALATVRRWPVAGPVASNSSPRRFRLVRVQRVRRKSSCAGSGWPGYADLPQTVEFDDAIPCGRSAAIAPTGRRAATA
jgi:hypothetical protein